LLYKRIGRPSGQSILLIIGLAVLDGVVAVPCNLQPAIAGSTPCWGLFLLGSGLDKWCWQLGLTQWSFM